MNQLRDRRDEVRAEMLYHANAKSTGVANLLWFFLGGLGEHRFYLGRSGTAVCQLLLGLFGWLPLFAGWIVLGLWLLVDAFLIPSISSNENQQLAYRLTR